MAVPSAVAAQFPEAAGLPTPLGCVGLDLLLFSADPAAVHDAFLAAAAVGSPSRAGSLRLLLSAPLHRSSSASDPHPDDEQDSSKAAASAAHAAADLATSQTGPGAESEELAASLSDRLTFDVCETLVPDLPEEAFHVIVCSNFHTSQQAELETMLAALYASLRQGGELFVSVLLVNRRLGPGVTPEQLEAAGVGCCHYAGDFIDAMRAVGFLQVRRVHLRPAMAHWGAVTQCAPVVQCGSQLRQSHPPCTPPTVGVRGVRWTVGWLALAMPMMQSCVDLWRVSAEPLTLPSSAPAIGRQAERLPGLHLTSCHHRVCPTTAGAVCPPRLPPAAGDEGGGMGHARRGRRAAGAAGGQQAVHLHHTGAEEQVWRGAHALPELCSARCTRTSGRFVG